MKDGKKRNGLLLALGVPKGEEGEGDEDADVGADMRRTAAEDAMKAFKSGDVDALDDALGRHYEACAMGAGHGSEEEPDEDIEDEGY